MRNLLVLSTCHDMVVGGVSTYFFRMFEWGRNNGWDCKLLVREDCYIENTVQKELDRLGCEKIEFLILRDKLNINEDIYFNDCNTIVITPDLHCYFKLKKVQDKKRIKNFVVKWYVLHPQASRICENKLVNYPYKQVVRKALARDLIFMDEETLTSCKDYYNFDKIDCDIIRLGMRIPLLEDDVIHNRIKSNVFNILTISRLEFPFKGYVIGLLKDFYKFVEVCPNSTLTIIGDGEGVDLLTKIINNFSEDIKNKIKLVSYVPYDELGEFIKDASVYVGMGTTLLDASILATPAIIATAFQMGNTSVGLFSDEYFNVGGNIAFSKKTDFYTELVKVYKMKPDEYENLQKKMRQTVINHYNIETIMCKLVNLDTMSETYENYGFILSIYDLFIVYFKKILHKLRGDIK